MTTLRDIIVAKLRDVGAEGLAWNANGIIVCTCDVVRLADEQRKLCPRTMDCRPARRVNCKWVECEGGKKE
jgi:hypothetical protein